MRVLIVDDELPARTKLRRLLGASADVEIVGEAATGLQAVATLKRSAVDVMFLDIQMPGLDGFGVLDAIASDVAPQVVFVTADERSAIRAFEVGAMDYLLKPFTPSRFEQVLERVRGRVRDAWVAAAPMPAAPPALKRLLVFENDHAMFLAIERIDRIAAERNYLSIVSEGRTFRVRGTMASLEARLDPAQFLRINRSTLVRLDAVQSMHEWSHGDCKILMRDGTELMWSRRYRAAAEKVFGVG